MKLHQYFLMFIVLIGILSLLGKMIIPASQHYNVTPSDNFTLMMTGLNSSEYTDKIETIAETSESGDDGFLAQFRTAKAVKEAASQTTSQSGALITTLGEYVGLPAELVTLIIVIIVVLAVFAGIYLLVS